jgi:hypothetical protein
MLHKASVISIFTQKIVGKIIFTFLMCLMCFLSWRKSRFLPVSKPDPYCGQNGGLFVAREAEVKPGGG